MRNWVLITGASEGLGREFAQLAAADGYGIILTARSKDRLNSLADDLRASGAEVEVILADLAQLDDVIRLWEEASKDRTISVLINNAGLGRNGPFGDEKGWARELSSINVNMTALTYLMKRAIPHMQAAGGGRVLNVSSVAGFLPGPNMAVYHATKAYVLFLSEAVAEELRGTDVTVTALCPGATATQFFVEAEMEDIRLLQLSKPMRADVVAKIGWDAAHAGKRSVVPGLINKIFAFSPRFSPRSLLTRVSSIIMGKP